MKCPRFCKKGASHEKTHFSLPSRWYSSPLAWYSTFWTSFVAAKGGEEIGNRLMLECILHTMQVILSVVLLTY